MKRSSKLISAEAYKPSSFVQRFAPQIAKASGGKSILDVACGSGRNAMALAQLGCSVICIDNDLESFQAHREEWSSSSLRVAAALLKTYPLDLVKEEWPFGDDSCGGIINVHFLSSGLFRGFTRSLSPGSHLLLETVAGHGGNYLELPKAQALRHAFKKTFEFVWYKERKVGPPDYDAVTVQMLAKKRK